MIRYCFALVVLFLGACNQAPSNAGADHESPNALPAARPGVVEDRFARLALACVHREFPNKISHVLSSADDARAPSELTPAFYGCFDWHSAVHGHWLLVRILATDPDTPMRNAIEAALSKSFTKANLEEELAYYNGSDRKSFERPYGIAWYLQLVTELDEIDNAAARAWRETLRPLEAAIVERIKAWLVNLAYPIRLGTHNQSAFAFGLMLDYARRVGDADLEQALIDKTLSFHAGDVDCPMAYEPSGEDFLSPCLMEADLMRRVLAPDSYATWLARFLPQIPVDGSNDWLPPGIVLDATDGKLVHLDGVNLSRAFALDGIISGLPAADARIPALRAVREHHRQAGLQAVSADHYAGSHWLASFAMYLTTRRGVSAD